MGRLSIMVAECKYKEFQSKEHFINSLNADSLMMEIIRDYTSMVDTSSVTRAQVSAWARRVQAQMIQNTMLDRLKERNILML